MGVKKRQEYKTEAKGEAQLEVRIEENSSLTKKRHQSRQKERGTGRETLCISSSS